MSKPNEPPVPADRHEIGCLEAIEMFYAYLDGELDDPREIDDFEKHMEHCRSCFSRTEMEKLLTDRLKQVARQRAPESLRRRVGKLLDEL